MICTYRDRITDRSTQTKANVKQGLGTTAGAILRAAYIFEQVWIFSVCLVQTNIMRQSPRRSRWPERGEGLC